MPQLNTNIHLLFKHSKHDNNIANVVLFVYLRQWYLCVDTLSGSSHLAYLYRVWRTCVYAYLSACMQGQSSTVTTPFFLFQLAAKLGIIYQLLRMYIHTKEHQKLTLVAKTDVNCLSTFVSFILTKLISKLI